MAMKFTTCYPTLAQGGRTPCGIVADRQTGAVQEMVCPEISDEICSRILSSWNDCVPAQWDGRYIEEELARFISDELQKL